MVGNSKKIRVPYSMKSKEAWLFNQLLDTVSNVLANLSQMLHRVDAMSQDIVRRSETDVQTQTAVTQ